jgi:hypothetical protein
VASNFKANSYLEESSQDLASPVSEGDWMTTPALSCQSILEVPLERSAQCTDDMAGLNLNPLCPLHSVSRVCHANFSNIFKNQ